MAPEKPEIPDDPAQLDHRLRRILERDQAHRLEARALREIGVVQPIVIGARQLDGPVAADDLAEGETGAGVEHRGADTDIFKKQLPALAADVGEGARRRDVAVRRMKMVDGRKRVLAARFGKAPGDILLRHVLDDRRDVLDHMAVAVDNFLSVLIFLPLIGFGSMLSFITKSGRRSRRYNADLGQARLRLKKEAPQC